MAIEKINFSYPKGTLQSVFDTEALTALELASKTSKKVDECVDLVNGVEQTAIESKAIVNDMQIVQEQFITDNADTRTQLISDNQTYLDGLTASKTQFETDLNASKTTFETNMTTAVNNIIANADNTIETNVNQKIDNMVNDGTIDNLINVDTQKSIAETTGSGVINGLQVLQQSSPNMTVLITGGVAHLWNGKRYEQLDNQNVTIESADVTNPRIDIIYINSEGVLSYGKGIAQLNPIPITPVNGIILAEINVTTGTTNIVTAKITDKRILKISLPDFQNESYDKFEVYDKKIDNLEINVKEYGAKGDGVTDDTTAFQNAFATGKSVLIPDGVYKLTSPIVVVSNINIRGNNAKIITTANYIFYNNNFVENINIDNVKFDGSLIASIFFPNAKNINVSKCKFENGVICVSIGDTLCDGFSFEKNSVENFSSYGLWLHNQMHVIIKDNYFNNVNDSNINISQKIDDKIHASIENNTIICSSSFASGHSVISTMCGSTTVRNNKVVNGTTAIVSHANDAGNDLGIKHYIYEGNIFIGCKVGINVNLDTNSKVIITNNHFDNFEIGVLCHNPDYATFDGLGDIIITDNYFDGGDAVYSQYQVPASIKLWYAKNCIVSRNLIKNPTYCGIMIRDKCENIKISDNLITQHQGIQCSDQTLFYGAPILLHNTANVQVKNIDIINNKIDGFLKAQSSILSSALAGGIVIYGRSGDTTLTKNIKIFDNEIIDGISNAIKAIYCDGIFADSNIILNTATDSELTGLTNSFTTKLKFNSAV